MEEISLESIAARINPASLGLGNKTSWHIEMLFVSFMSSRKIACSILQQLFRSKMDHKPIL